MRKILRGSEALFLGTLTFLNGRRSLPVGVLEEWIEAKGPAGSLLYTTEHCRRNEAVEVRVWMEKAVMRGQPTLVRRVEFRLTHWRQKPRAQRLPTAA